MNARVLERAPALQYRDFRLMWGGQLLSQMGSQMQLTAVDWHIFTLLQGTTYSLGLLGRTYELNASALGLGSLGLVRIVPIILFALIGGILADTQDRRRLMLYTQSAAALFALLLAMITLSGNASIAAIYALTAAGAAAAAFDNPARQSLVPNLVSREHLTNAVSLNTLLWQISTIVGPAIGGLLISQFNIGLIYALNAVSFLAVIVALLKMHYRGKAAATNTGLGWDALVEGLRFVHGSRIIWGTMLVDFFATFFSSARTMLPIVAADVLGVGPQGYGLLVTAQPVGALIAGAFTALRKEIHRQGYVLLVSVAIYGLATALFGVSTVFALSYVFFAMTGAADTVSTVIRGTIRQLMTPDHLRGRMTSVNMMFFMGGPQLGEMEAGLVAALFGAPLAIFTGGIATILLTGWVAWKYPHLRQYTSDTEAEVREVMAAG
ncbi:MAG: MFS transporter [Ardenticatenales bacterium]|nr:MFS transporter [Ardenticatenales bacterium]